MLFHSPPFFAFFAVYFLLQLAIPIRYRLWLVLAGGTIFYAYWNPWLLWLPHLLALTGWAGALWVSASSERNGRRRRLLIAASLLLAPLLFFKYTSFVYREIIEPMLGTPDWSLGLPLPLGISFVTFTMLAYLIDCYRGVYPVEARPQMVSGYMVFFPHLIAGPILRPRELMPQLDRPRRALDVNATLGVLIFTVGLVKKVIFAGQLADPVGQVYAGGNGLSALDHLLAIYGFSLQIYCDFSGYTDMAIGLALLLGVKLPNNFARPYAAASVAEFWRRWHRTLSFWFRDYVYIPLGGNRGGRWKTARNVMITLLVCGLWHGAAWTYLAFGAVQGLLLIGYRTFNEARTSLPRVKSLTWVLDTLPGTVACVAVTFLTFCVSLVIFRATSFATAGTVFRHLVVRTGGLGLPMHSNGLWYTLVLVILAHLAGRFGAWRRLQERLPAPVLGGAYAAALTAALLFAPDTGTAFIYFQF
jgi:D-alanyl-lipoteichoic acid acyltransferase DltB (MBOAT superfamily)